MNRTGCNPACRELPSVTTGVYLGKSGNDRLSLELEFWHGVGCQNFVRRLPPQYLFALWA